MQKQLRNLLGMSQKYSYSKCGLENIPRNGIIGYITNNPLATYDFLSEPAEKFNFHIKNFSQLQDTPLLKKLSLTNSQNLQKEQYDIYSLNSKKRIINHEDDEGLYFLQNFPKNQNEAVDLEKMTGGLNLFICFNYLNYEETDLVPTNFLQGNKGTIKKKEIIEFDHEIEEEPDNRENRLGLENLELSNDIENLDVEEEEFGEVVVSENKVEDNEGLLRFYDDRGLLLFFDVHPKENIANARLRLLKSIVEGFKY